VIKRGYKKRKQKEKGDRMNGKNGGTTGKKHVSNKKELMD
jgi:hypothetical protein